MLVEDVVRFEVAANGHRRHCREVNAVFTGSKALESLKDIEQYEESSGN